MEMEDKKIDTAAEQALPVQELPADIPAEAVSYTHLRAPRD